MVVRVYAQGVKPLGDLGRYVFVQQSSAPMPRARSPTALISLNAAMRSSPREPFILPAIEEVGSQGMREVYRQFGRRSQAAV